MNRRSYSVQAPSGGMQGSIGARSRPTTGKLTSEKSKFVDKSLKLYLKIEMGKMGGSERKKPRFQGASGISLHPSSSPLWNQLSPTAVYLQPPNLEL